MFSFSSTVALNHPPPTSWNVVIAIVSSEHSATSIVGVCISVWYGIFSGVGAMVLEAMFCSLARF